MASKKSGQIWRWIGIVVGVLAILPIYDEMSRAMEPAKFFFTVGILFLIAYASTLLFKKVKLAWIFFCCCACYFVTRNLWDVGIFTRSWWINFEPIALIGILGMLIRSAIECFLLLTGYFGLLDLEESQSNATAEIGTRTNDVEK